MKVELHCHTRISDGSFTFGELLDLAEREGVSTLAVTNHDTTMGLGEMAEEASARGIAFIPAIEISAYDFKRERRVHVLGYCVEQGHPALEALCGPLIEQRHRASKLMVERLIEAGYKIAWEQVKHYAEGGTGVYKQHIMHALIDGGYADAIYGSLYKRLFARGGSGQSSGIAFVPLEYVDMNDAVRAIRQAGGVPVLAHPGQYDSFDAVPELAESGLAGIEVWHPLHSREDEMKAKSLAVYYGFVKTGGSDFHGFYGETAVRLGSKDPGFGCVEALQALKGAGR